MNAENIIVHTVSFFLWLLLVFLYSRSNQKREEAINMVRALRMGRPLSVLGRPSQVLERVAGMMGVDISFCERPSNEDVCPIHILSLAQFLFSLKCDRIECKYDPNDSKIILCVPSDARQPSHSIGLISNFFKAEH